MLAKPEGDLIRLAVLRREQQRIGGEIRDGKLFPIGPQLTALLPLQPSSSIVRQWYVVQVAPRRERDVEKELQAIGIDHYCPREPKTVKGNNAHHHRVVIKPMLVGYVFAGFDERAESGRWKTIPTIDGVIRLLMYQFADDDQRPVPVAAHIVERLRVLESERAGGKGRRLIPADISLGQVSRVVDGPFASFLGEVIDIDRRKGQINVEIDIFGRKTPVWLDAWQVEAV